MQSWLKKADIYSADSVQKEGQKRAVPDSGSPQRQRTKQKQTNSSTQGSWPPPTTTKTTTSRSSPLTVRSVSPRILSLCSKFGSAESAEKDTPELLISSTLTRSVSTPNISDEKSDDEEISALLNRRSGSTKNLRLTLDPSDSVSSESTKHMLLSPGYSPSSGYCSGVSNSPVCLSPRSQSPTMNEVPEKARSNSLCLPDTGHLKTLRTHSQDSGVSSIAHESPRTLRKTLSAGNRSDSDEFGLSVPKLHRQRTLRRSNNIVSSDSVESDSSSLGCAISKESLLSPDEGFQEVEKLAAEYAASDEQSPRCNDGDKSSAISKLVQLKQDSRDSDSSIHHQSVSQRNSLDVVMRRDYWARSETLSTIQSSFDCMPPAVIVSDHCDRIMEEDSTQAFPLMTTDSSVPSLYLTIEDIDNSKKLLTNKHEELERKLSSSSSLSTFSTLSRDSSLCVEDEPTDTTTDSSSKDREKALKSVSVQYL